MQNSYYVMVFKSKIGTRKLPWEKKMAESVLLIKQSIYI